MEKDQQTIQAYDSHAESFEDRFMDLDLYQDSLEAFIGRVAPGAVVLDLGCGPGNISRFLLDRIEGADVTGIDLAPAMVKRARENVPEGKFRVEDIRHLDFAADTFDAVIAGFCLPSLDDNEAVNLISKIGGMVKPGGHLYLSCMEGKGQGFETTSFTGKDEIFINYFSETFLRKTVAGAGFDIEACFRQDYREPDGRISRDLFMFAVKISPA